MPAPRESVRVIGPDSIMSSALPAGAPSKISVKTTSASSLSTIRCAVVEPTNPPPTTVTFFLLIPLLGSDNVFLCESYASLRNGPRDAVLNQRGRFLPPQELKHHRAREHHGTRIDHILVRILWRGAVRCFKNAESVADIRS